MGIEKYFQTTDGSSSKKKESAETTTTKNKATGKAAAAAAKPAAASTRKRKAIVDQDDDEDNEDDDFQEASVKSKHFSSSQQKAAEVEKKVDPKTFFGSSMKATSSSSAASAVKKETTASAKPAPPTYKLVKEEVLTKSTTIKKETVAAKKDTPAKSTRKAAPKESYVISDSEDDDDAYVSTKEEEEEDSDVEMSEPAQSSKAKKAKRDTSFEEPPKATKPAAAAKKATHAAAAKQAAVKKEADDEMEVDEKPAAKKKNNFFQMMKNQEGPKALGTRPEPVGASNCLQNMTFVISGQYETLTRDQTKDIILRYGGRVTGAVSGKTNYLAMGRDAGESKINKAKQVGTKVLDEDAFYTLVESSAPQKVEFALPPKASASKGKAKASDTVDHILLTKDAHKTQLWTEKYKPTQIGEIVGNKELVKRINEWLGNWQSNFQKGFEGEGDDLNNWRALLLSGPPGIGKTTAAQVVAQTNGYEPLEFNASDVRSKKILEASISEMMDNRTMTEFFQPKSAAAGKKPAEVKLLQGKKVVLIMDEVDGMSAGDRGGAVELAGLIRKSKIPVICICNDSRSQKVAPLLRVCFEAKFKRTPAAQIRAKILSICFKEKLKMAPNAVDELVAATHNDIRQVINILSTYRLKEDGMDYDQAKAVGKNNEKYSILSLFEIPLELLGSGRWREKTLTEKADVYFHDYALAHLMIWENYLRGVTPERARAPDGNPRVEACNEMDLTAKAAEAMADGDLVDSMIHGTVQHYSLMPVHSIMSCVSPASYMRGSIRGKMMFPSWLGQNSKAGKYARALADIQTRMRLKASGDKFEIRQNYIPTLNERIFGELADENFDEAMGYMDNYYLDRESLDTLSELTFTAKGAKNPLMSLPAKAKTTFTRQYNAKNHPILFQLSGAPIKKSVSGPKEDAEGTIIEEDEATFGDDVSEEEETDNKEDDPEQDLQNIKFIKESTKKRKAATTTNASASKKLKSKK